MEMFEIALPDSTGCNMQLADPYLLNWYEQAENRTLWLDKELADDGVEIAKKIIRWNFEDADHDIPVEKRKPIRVMLLSPGGDLYVMLAIIDAIMMSKTPVYTCAVSLAASAACAILVSGHKRYAFPHAHGMWHSGSGAMSGTTGQMQDTTKHLDTVERQLQNMLMERTNVSSRLLKKYKDRDWYLSADEMLEHGFIDKIVDDIDEIL